MPSLLLPLLLAGCATTFTNLTPQLQERKADNQYPVEVALDCSQQSLRWETIRPSIIVGTESFPMQPTPLMTNRWEGYVPVPPGAELVRYHYKFDFNYNSFGKPKADSAVSPEYTLRVKGK
ncbi:MAG: hypothetical protein ABSF95_15455 [Verrucomicrobiota bacterium]